MARTFLVLLAFVVAPVGALRLGSGTESFSQLQLAQAKTEIVNEAIERVEKYLVVTRKETDKLLARKKAKKMATSIVFTDPEKSSGRDKTKKVLLAQIMNWTAMLHHESKKNTTDQVALFQMSDLDKRADIKQELTMGSRVRNVMMKKNTALIAGFLADLVSLAIVCFTDYDLLVDNLLMLAWWASGVYVFSVSQSMSFVESFYALAQIPSTVGYGDYTVTALADPNDEHSPFALSMKLWNSLHVFCSALYMRDDLDKYINMGRTAVWKQFGFDGDTKEGRLVGFGVEFLIQMVFNTVYYGLEFSKTKKVDKMKGMIDAFYMSIITMSSVGYGDQAPTTDQGKVINTFLQMIGGNSFDNFVRSTEK